MQPNSALIVVDVQNDFLDGNLALRNCPAGQDGLGVIPAINSVLDTVNFELVVYTRDWHPEDHISFAENKHIRPFHSTSQVSLYDRRYNCLWLRLVCPSHQSTTHSIMSVLFSTLSLYFTNKNLFIIWCQCYEWDE